MSKSAWPINTDVNARIAAAGLTAPSDTARTDVFIAAAVEWWNQQTGYNPFRGATGTRVFDPPGSISGHFANPIGGGSVLMLDNGIVTLTSLSINGVAKTLGTDFWMKPDNAAGEGRPWEMVKFAYPIFGTPQTISIVGVWGFCAAAAIPELAWQSVLDVAAGAYCVPEIAQALAPGGMTGWKEDDVEEDYTKPVAREFLKAFEMAKSVAEMYHRTAVYVGR